MPAISMASGSDYSTYVAVQTSMPRQSSTVHDLYGLVGVLTPNATEAEIRKAYETMVKELLPQLPSNAAKAAFTVLSNPAMRAQYDRDRLGYLYAHFNSHELFPTTAMVEKNESLEEQIEVYAAVLQDNISDPIEDKKVKIHARLFQIRKELDDYKEKSKVVQEEWATSANQILRMGANALREVEICARADIEMLENELGGLRGELPLKNGDGPPGRIASGQYGSDTGGLNKSKFHLAMNQRAPSIPRSPTVPVQLRSASKLGGRIENSSTGDESPSIARSESTMAVDDRVQKYLIGSAPSPTFYAPVTFLDPVKSQHDMERIIARAKRQSLDPETLSDLIKMKSDKLPKSAGKTPFVSFDTTAFPEYDPAVKQKKASHKLRYNDLLKKDGGSKHLAKIGETVELPQMQYESQLETHSDRSSSAIVPEPSPPGLGLVEYQERFGCHVITDDAKETLKKEVGESRRMPESAKEKAQKPWVSINDSVSMPPYLSSTRAPAHTGAQPTTVDKIDSPIDRPGRPFHRTTRGAVSAEFAPVYNDRAKQVLTSLSDETMQQKNNISNLAQPIPQKPSQTLDRTAIIKSVQAAVWQKAQMAKAAREAEESQGIGQMESEVGNETEATQVSQKAEQKNEGEVCDTTMQKAMERSTSRLKKEEAARTLVQLSREAGAASHSQQQGLPNIGGTIQDEDTQLRFRSYAGAQEDDVQGSGFQHGGAQHGGPHYDDPQQSSVPYAYGLYDAIQRYDFAQQPAAMYPSGRRGGPVLPPVNHGSIRQAYETRGQVLQPYIDWPSPYGAIGSEVKALKEKAQEEKMTITDEQVREKRKAALEQAMEASRLGPKLSLPRNDNNDPFVD